MFNFLNKNYKNVNSKKKEIKVFKSTKLDRREFIKKIGLANLALFVPTFWISQPIYGFNGKELTFEEIYPVPFYEKDWFIPAVIAGTIVITAAILFFTAGAGAPAAAPGVSTIASWIGGGGAGSYMAGLSTVGSWFGGNAILGAAILNSISLTFLGGVGAASKAGLSVGEAFVALSDLVLTGIQLKDSLDKRNSNSDGLLFEIAIPYDLGSETIKKHILEPLENISDKISDVQNDLLSLHQEICELTAEKDFSEIKKLKREIKKKYERLQTLVRKKKSILNLAVEFLKRNMNNLSIEDLLVLTIIANNTANEALFEKSLYLLNNYANFHTRKNSFIEYLNGILFLEKGNYKKAQFHLYKALYQEPFVVEIGIALISALSERYSKHKNEILKIIKIIENSYDDDNYKGKNLQILYYHAGNTALINKDYNLALKFFQKAYDALPFIVKHIPLPHIGPFKNLDEVKNFFQIPIAITYKFLGQEKKGKKILNEILERCNNVSCKEECREKYLKWYELANKKMEV